MGTIEDEDAAHINDARTVQTQGLDRHPSDVGQSLDSQEVLAPGEMIAPTIIPRVEQPDLPARPSIVALSPRSLGSVASLAGLRQIARSCRSTVTDRHDVIDGMSGHEGESLRHSVG
jgi:hypothetical protein